MNSFLMFQDKDFKIKNEFLDHEEDLIKDLELETIYKAASKDDEMIWQVFKTATLELLTKKEDILYRQNALKDALSNKNLINSLYELSQKATEEEKKVFFGFFRKYPDVILHSSLKRVEISIRYIKLMMKELNNSSNNFKSKAFLNLIKRFEENFNDEILIELKKYLQTLLLRDGTIISFSFGEGLNATDPLLLKSSTPKTNWLKNIIHKRKKRFIYCINPKDESGERVISDIKNQGINKVADTIFKTANHLRNFIKIFHTELAFYSGAINLYDELKKSNSQLCYPRIFDKSKKVEEFKELKDITLLLTKKEAVVSNNLKANDKELFIITGANKGGKTSYVRALGTAQIMAEIGIFTVSKECSLNICQKIFTHFKKDEDTALQSGKFDEELKRLSLIIDFLTPNSLIIFNESFASTNETEASLIASDIIQAILEKNIKIFFVTHMYSFAKKFYDKNNPHFIFLKAIREENGNRNYKIEKSPPLPTSYGEDIYNKIFKK